MKIAYLLGSLNRGGTETLLLDVFRNVIQNQLDAVGIYRETGNMESDFLKCGVPVYKINFKKNLLKGLFDLRKTLKEEDVQIVHAQQPIDALFGRIASTGTSIKVLLTIHGYDFEQNMLGKYILHYIIRRTDLNIYVSDTQRQYYQMKYHLNSNKQKLVYNGISFDKLITAEVSEKNKSMTSYHPKSIHGVDIREELSLTHDSLLIGTVGNFNDVRTQITLCRFLNLLKKENVDFQFIFIGGRDENKPQLFDQCVEYCTQNALSGSVSFLGIRNDVPQILPQLNAFIYSSEHDTFGLAVIEAMAVGIPVFVNDWNVMLEITQNGKFATLYKTDDEQDLLRKFMLFLQNRIAYQTLAIDAVDFVLQKYNIELHIKNLKEVYYNICK
jgi:glycosyltransferase involved in cell wall biosynthesis